MTEGHVGRLLAASLHQAIADALPQRLEFYEHWLHSEGLRDGRIGLAAMSAVLGFLRTEGAGYDVVMQRAGTLAGEWGFAMTSSMDRALLGWSPRRWRPRVAARIAARVAAGAVPHGRVRPRVDGTRGRLQVSGSPFCAGRSTAPSPLCGFYQALVARVLECCAIEGDAAIESCRAVDGSPCVVLVTFGPGTTPARLVTP